MQLIIPFDGGIFVSPCMGESGILEIGIEGEPGEDFESFVFAPHGYFEEKNGNDFIPELN